MDLYETHKYALRMQNELKEKTERHYQDVEKTQEVMMFKEEVFSILSQLAIERQSSWIHLAELWNKVERLFQDKYIK